VDFQPNATSVREVTSRRVRLVVLLGLLTLGAAATAAAAGDRHPRDPREAFTAADQAWARRIVLKPSDVRGWRALRSPPDESRCTSFDPDMSDLTLTGKAESPDFERGGLVVSTAAEVFRSKRDAVVSFRRGAKPQLIRCLHEAFVRGAGTQVRVRLLSGRVVAAPPVGERRFAARLVWAITGQAQTVRAYADVVGWDRGRASAAVGVFSVAEPPDRGLQRRLAALLDRRMRR
jgi:hypothetical protein